MLLADEPTGNLDSKMSVVFLTGLLLGAAMATGVAQSNRLAGDNYVNHVGMAVDNFDETYNFYTQKMGFPEAFTVKDQTGNRGWPTCR